MSFRGRAARVSGSVLVAATLGACSDGAHSPTSSFAPAAAVAALQAGNGESATAGTPVATAPTVKVTTATGQPVAGTPVRFVVVQGGGAVQSAVALTDAQGVASAGAWTLGPLPGDNVVEARFDALPPVRFTASALSPFNIELHFSGTPSAAQQAAVEAAVATWRAVLVGSLPDVQVHAAAGACFAEQPAVDEVVNDLLLWVRVAPIDGVGKTLAESGPCFVRSGSKLPVMGALVLDAADLPRLEADGSLQDVITHEIGHILGIGTIWTDLGLLSGAGGADPLFLGTRALGAYLQLGPAGSGVPVENTGGAGTRDGHWRESVFGNELMTGYINQGANPLSAVTIASLADLGYTVNLAAAQPYALPTGAARGDLVPLLDLEPHEVLRTPRYEVPASR